MIMLVDGRSPGLDVASPGAGTPPDTTENNHG
jgi:hypothetical protein